MTDYKFNKKCVLLINIKKIDRIKIEIKKINLLIFANISYVQFFSFNIWILIIYLHRM
jgi:hypothetical protein